MSIVDATNMTKTTGKSSNDDGEGASTTTTATLPKKTSDSTTNATTPARQWFTGLTVTEMNNVMSSSRYGNDDDHRKLLWQAMVQTATAATTIIGGDCGGSTTIPEIGSNGRRTNDENWWETKVPVSTIERLWSRNGNRNGGGGDDRAPAPAPASTTTTAATVGGEIGAVGNGNGNGNNAATNDYEDQEHPDTYRIRADTNSGKGSGDKVVQQRQQQHLGKDQEKSQSGEDDTHDEKGTALVSSTSNEVSPPSSSEETTKAPSLDKDSSSVRLFIENISVVLPKHREQGISEAMTLSDGAQEVFMSFNPSYLQTTSSHDLVSSLDEIMRTMTKGSAPPAGRSDFLGRNARAVGTFWEYVEAYISITADNDTQSATASKLGSSPDKKIHFIPLYMLVLLHFEYSAYRAHDVSKTLEGSNDRAAIDGKNHSPDTGIELPSDDTVIIPLDKVMKKLFEQKYEDSSSVHDIALFLQSLVGDTDGMIPKAETNERMEIPELSPDVSRPNTSVPPPPPAATTATTLDETDTISPSTTDDVEKKTTETDTVEAVQELEIDDNPTNPSGSPSSKSKSGRKSSGKGGKKKKKKNKKKKSSTTAQEKLDLETSDGKVEHIEDELQELKIRQADDDAAGNKISGIEAKIVEPTSDEDDQVLPNDGIPDAQKAVVDTVVEEIACDDAKTNVDPNQSEIPKSSDQAPTSITTDTIKNPSPAEESITAPTLNSQEDNRRLPETTTVTFDDSSTDSSKIMVHQSSNTNPAEVDEKSREEVQPSPAKIEANDESGNGPADDSVTFDDGEWETVETRTRNTRKKKNNNDRNGQSGGRSGQGPSGEQGGCSRRKRDRERKRAQNRRSAKENQSTELDSGADRGRRARSESDAQSTVAVTPSPSAGAERQGSTMASRIASKTSSSSPVVRQNITNNSSTGASGSTMRDVLLGKKSETSTQDSAHPSRPKPMAYSERARVGLTSDKTQRTKTEIGGKATTAADQNTIPTVPETLSAISATSAFKSSISNANPRDPEIARNTDSGSDESDVAQKEPDSPPQPVKGTSPSPPLPTLLNPCNNNSSSSSVASSLEAPHSREHGKNTCACEDDVGFHLLGVCKRLSNDVSVFMKRRDEALAVRRRERRLVLNALEDSLGTLWPGMSSVEMYGSCATDLDLPSSDLDVVVCGLDRPRPRTNESSPSKSESGIPESNGTPSAEGSNKKSEAMPRVSSQPVFSHYGPDSQQYSPNKHNIPVVHGHMYGHMSLNAERVVRLSMELERQPWAVHVKAIPTATVPVIKILADPARVPGAPSKGSEDWFLQHTPIAGQRTQVTGAASTTIAQEDPQPATIHDSRSSGQNAVAPFSTSGEAPPLWRGADVTNGLLNVDITFEGPEHGGIGSTKFSQRVVEEFASKSGLSPEETPEVQALMVLKELLAQRRLNEPFSGGLSSYALLLLVVSVLKEREIIREELDKVEMQRRDVASGGENSALQATTELKEEKVDVTTKSTGAQTSQKKKKKKKGAAAQELKTGSSTLSAEKSHSKREATTGRAQSNHNGEMKQDASSTGIATASKVAVSSSWASIAKPINNEQKSVFEGTGAPTASSSLPAPASPSTAPQPSRKVLKKPSSFADAVAKGMPSVPTLPSARMSVEGGSSGQKTDNSSQAGKKIEDGKKATSKPNVTDVSLANNTGAPVLPSLQPSGDKNKSGENAKSSSSVSTLQERVMEIVTEGKKLNGAKDRPKKEGKTPSSDNTSVAVLSNPDESKFPQGFHDVIEVLCSGDTTPGKLLMHFLLFYGQHFDSHSTAIDYSGTHTRNPTANLGYSVRSPYMKRQSAGAYDPVTGMFTVDPIVVYDPLEGAETNNVARSCFLWSNVRWVFMQSYMTLSSAAETNQGGSSDAEEAPPVSGAAGRGPTYGHDKSGNVVVDPNSPLLELLLSF